MYIIEYETTVSKYVISNVIYDDDNNKIKGIGSFFYTDTYMFAKFFKNKEECNAVVNFMQNHIINRKCDIELNSIKIKKV